MNDSLVHSYIPQTVQSDLWLRQTGYSTDLFLENSMSYWLTDSQWIKTCISVRSHDLAIEFYVAFLFLELKFAMKCKQW